MKKELVLTLCITLCGCALTFGITQNKVENNTKQIDKLELTHEKDIDALKEQQKQTDALLQSMNNNLASINTKLDLLVEGKLKQDR